MTTVLVIDDDSQILHLCGELLEREGYDVVEAETAEAGITACQNRSIDLVLTDIIMPGKEGLETISELRGQFPEIKIIAMSGGGRLGPDSYLPLAEKFGAGGILAKPFTRKELLAAVARLLSQNPIADEMPSDNPTQEPNG